MAGQDSKPQPHRHPEVMPDEQPPSTSHSANQPEFQDTVIGDSADSRHALTTHTALPAAFARYRVIRLLGRGGMGSVYLGHDEELDRAIAIKVPHREWFATDQGRDAFLREARTLARLEHPRIIPVYDAGQTSDGSCFVVFKHVDSQTLRDYMQGRRLPHREVSNILAEVADALHYAHKQGFVHRDIKPSNILIDRDNNPWVADFGLAVAESTQAGLAGEISGTPAYMSPEQSRGAAHHLDGRTDIWSLGVMLYELLTGRRPFVGEDASALFAEIAQKEPRPPRMIDESIPRELERITIKCLRKEITERYNSAHDLARDLRSWDRKPTAAPILFGSVAAIAVLTVVTTITLQSSVRPQVAEPTAAVETNTAEADTSMERSEFALLLEEMRGLRRDLGETSPGLEVPVAVGRSAESSDATSPPGIPEAGSSTAAAVDLPAGEWAPIPLPAGFTDFEEKLLAAREAGEQNVEKKLLLNATNKLIEDGHFGIAEHLAHRMVELAGNADSDVPFAYGQLGLAQYRLGKFSTAIASYQRSSEVYQRLFERMMGLPKSERVLMYRSHLARLWGITLMRIGNVHKADKNYQLAQIYYEQAKKLYVDYQRDEELATLLLNYGSLEANHGNYQQAIELLRQGLDVTHLSTDGEAEFHVNLGNAYSRSGESTLALEQYQQAYELITADSGYTLRSALLGNYATLLLEEGRSDQALPLLRELKSIARPGDTVSQRVLEFLLVLEKESSAGKE